MKAFQPGDLVVYTKQKFSSSPGPRAKKVNPAKRGETYSYTIDKYWTVGSLVDESKLTLYTRTGKEHVIAVNDPNLRTAYWWERWLFASKFPQTVETSKSS